MDYYKVLGVTKNASESDLKKAYVVLAHGCLIFSAPHLACSCAHHLMCAAGTESLPSSGILTRTQQTKMRLRKSFRRSMRPMKSSVILRSAASMIDSASKACKPERVEEAEAVVDPAEQVRLAICALRLSGTLCAASCGALASAPREVRLLSSVSVAFDCRHALSILRRLQGPK